MVPQLTSNKAVKGAWCKNMCTSIPLQNSPENDAALMFALSIPVCWPGFSFTLMRKEILLTFSWTKQHWGDQGNQLFANKPRNPRSCSVLHISQCSEHRLMWLRSPSKRSTKSSLRPFGLRTMETKNTINTMQTVSIIFCNI